MSQQKPQGPSLAAALPDVNAQTNPFETVQSLLDEAAYFNLFIEPEPRQPPAFKSGPVFDIDGGFVLNPRGALHHFDNVGLRDPFAQRIGGTAGSYRDRWHFSSEDFAWSPDEEPPPVLFDPTRSQRFTMQDTRFVLGSGADSFQGYGQGMTHPVIVEGERQVLAGGVGNIIGGEGKFSQAIGTYVLNGRITPEHGFQGNATVRVLDPNGIFRSEGKIEEKAGGLPCNRPDEASYAVIRGQKANPNDPSLYAFFDGKALPSGLDTPAQLHAANYLFGKNRSRGLSTRLTIGAPFGELEATILFNVLEPPGTADRPDTFETRNVYRFYDSQKKVVGIIRANVQLGRTFNLSFPSLPDQQGLRYGGVGPIIGSSGVFGSVQGMVAVDSVVGIAPHALSLLNVLRIVDPQGKFQTSPIKGSA